MPYVRKLSLLLLTAFTTALSYGQQTYLLNETQIRNIALAYDSLDECKEVTDSLQVQINNALTVISHDSALISNLRQMALNQGEIISAKDVLIQQEKQVSAAYRKKYRLWKILSFVFGGLTVYQIVK